MNEKDRKTISIFFNFLNFFIMFVPSLKEFKVMCEAKQLNGVNLKPVTLILMASLRRSNIKIFLISFAKKVKKF
jgi:hypothetical protein